VRSPYWRWRRGSILRAGASVLPTLEKTTSGSSQMTVSREPSLRSPLRTVLPANVEISSHLKSTKSVRRSARGATSAFSAMAVRAPVTPFCHTVPPESNQDHLEICSRARPAWSLSRPRRLTCVLLCSHNYEKTCFDWRDYLDEVFSRLGPFPTHHAQSFDPQPP
jgi:hypothetical protein